MIIYDRIYYTLYRMILKLADLFDIDRESPRTEVALILSFLTAVNIITIFGLLSAFTGESIISGKKLYVMIMLSPIVVLNFLFIFYNHRYKKIEEKLSSTWKTEKRKNILIMLLYVSFTIACFCLSVGYIKSHSLK